MNSSDDRLADSDPRTFTVFSGYRLVASGTLEPTVRRAKEEADQGQAVLLLDDLTGEQIDLDLSGSADDAVARLAGHPVLGPLVSRARAPVARPGRPRLGVVSREVSLLPRHWDWLATQNGGASAALRRLVDEARKRNGAKDRAARARDAVARFLWVVAGNLPGFEEASRSLYGRDLQRFLQHIEGWPADVRQHAERLVREAVRLGELADAAQ
ncbi:MAG: DUF2239 family protein [Polyangiaceae bacterium]|nr:DUF2239 family protein [Polyangiaceae bacterium]